MVNCQLIMVNEKTPPKARHVALPRDAAADLPSRGRCCGNASQRAAVWRRSSVDTSIAAALFLTDSGPSYSAAPVATMATQKVSDILVPLGVLLILFLCLFATFFPGISEFLSPDPFNALVHREHAGSSQTMISSTPSLREGQWEDTTDC